MTWCVLWVADGGVDHQIQKLAANILNKKLHMACQEWSLGSEIWRKDSNLILLKKIFFRITIQNSGRTILNMGLHLWSYLLYIKFKIHKFKKFIHLPLGLPLSSRLSSLSLLSPDSPSPARVCVL